MTHSYLDKNSDFPYYSNSPYPGLRPFERHETDIFFGREEHTDQLVNKLRETHFIAVIGLSGVGKSSLIRTGLIPALQTGFLAQAGVDWSFLELRPSDSSNPFELLVDKLLEQHSSFFQEQTNHNAIREQLLRKPSDILKGLNKSLEVNLLIVIDQFEELFRLEDEFIDKQENFVDLLLKLCQHPNMYVVITIRSDYIGRCARFLGLPEIINQGIFLTPRLELMQLRNAIERPARVFNGRVEPPLVECLVNELIKDDPDRLPLMQHALMRMWQLAVVENSEQPVLTLMHYEKVGGLTQALSEHANEIFNKLESNQQKIAEILFRSLTEGNSRDHYTRRRVKLQDIATLVEVSWEQVTTVVEAFRQPERNFIMPALGNLKPETILDITHECLIPNWDRLKQWVDQEADWVDKYNHLKNDAYVWKKNGKKENDLLTSRGRLEEAVQWLKNDNPTSNWAKRYDNDEGQQFDLAKDFINKSHHQGIKQKIGFWLFFIIVTTILASTWNTRSLNQKAKENLKEIEKLMEQTEEINEKANEYEKEVKISLFNNKIITADTLIKNNNYQAAKRELEDSRELDSYVSPSSHYARELRVWFSELMGGTPQRVFRGAGTELFTIAVNSNNHLVAAGGGGGIVAVFDDNKGTLLQRLPEHTQDVRSVVFYPLTQQLITADEDRQIIFWSWQQDSFKVAQQWEAPAKVWAIAISPDGKQLVSGGTDTNITRWQIATKEKQTLKGATDSITDLTFDSTGRRLAIASYDDTAEIRDLKEEKQQWLVGHLDDVESVTFSPDGNRLATTSRDETIRLWDVNSGKRLGLLKGHQGSVFSSQFILDGRYLVSAGEDGTLRLWDIDSEITLRVLQGHQGRVTDVAVAGQAIWSASTDDKVARWGTELPYLQIVELPKEPSSTAIAPQSDLVAVGFADGSLQLYSLSNANQTLSEPKQAHQADIPFLTFNATGNLLATASFDGRVKVWSVENNQLGDKPIADIPHQDAVSSVAFSPDGKLLATASYDGQIGLFVPQTGEKIYSPSPPPHQGEGAYSVAFNAESTRLLSSGGNGIYLWEVKDKTLSQLKDFPPTENQIVQAVTFSPDGQRFIGVGAKKPVVGIYAMSGESRQETHLPRHTDTIMRALFSPNGQQLVTASADATIRFWDLTKLDEEILTLRLPVHPAPPAPLWQFDFRCTATGAQCWIAVPLITDSKISGKKVAGKLVLYQLEGIYDK